MSKKQKTISILGSTGSIGVQTLQVLETIPEQFRIGYLSTNHNIDLLAQQVKKFNPIGVAIKDKTAYHKFKSNVDFNGKILVGKKA